MHITVSDKLDMRTIIWPNNVLAELLPVPKSDYGNISSSSDKSPDFSLNALLRQDTKCRTNFCFNKSIGEDIAPKYYAISRTFQFSICEVAVISNTKTALIAGSDNLYSFSLINFLTFNQRKNKFFFCY